MSCHCWHEAGNIENWYTVPLWVTCFHPQKSISPCILFLISVFLFNFGSLFSTPTLPGKESAARVRMKKDAENCKGLLKSGGESKWEFETAGKESKKYAAGSKSCLAVRGKNQYRNCRVEGYEGCLMVNRTRIFGWIYRIMWLFRVRNEEMKLGEACMWQEEGWKAIQRHSGNGPA